MHARRLNSSLLLLLLLPRRLLLLQLVASAPGLTSLRSAMSPPTRSRELVRLSSWFTGPSNDQAGRGQRRTTPLSPCHRPFARDRSCQALRGPAVALRRLVLRRLPPLLRRHPALHRHRMSTTRHHISTPHGHPPRRRPVCVYHHHHHHHRLVGLRLGLGEW